MPSRSLPLLAATLSLLSLASCSPEPSLDQEILATEENVRWTRAELERQLRDAQLEKLKDDSFRRQLKDLDQATEAYDATAAAAETARAVVITALSESLSSAQERLADLKTKRALAH